MAKPSLIGDFIGFIRHEKKWWMIPLVLVIVGLGLVSVFVTSSSLSPFVYSLF